MQIFFTPNNCSTQTSNYTFIYHLDKNKTNRKCIFSKLIKFFFFRFGLCAAASSVLEEQMAQYLPSVVPVMLKAITKKNDVAVSIS